MSHDALRPDPDTPGAFTVRVGRADQSWVDPDDPLRLEFDYVQRIADALDLLWPEGQRVRAVHVGGAGMTLPRYLAATRPTSAQIVLEPDAELTAAVREHLPLPRRSGIKVRPVDGRTGVAALRADSADVIIVDAFVGARVPPELGAWEFFADCARVLGPRGVIVANVTDRAPFEHARRVVAGLARVREHVLLSTEPATLKGRRFGNVVLLAAGRPLPVEGLARRAAGSAFPYRLVEGEALTRLVAGARAYEGDDTAASPVPPELWSRG